MFDLMGVAFFHKLFAVFWRSGREFCVVVLYSFLLVGCGVGIKIFKMYFTY
jgi:hypothetical protein